MAKIPFCVRTRPRPPQVPHGRRARPRLRAGAAARRAGLRRWHFDLRGFAFVGLFERNRHVVLQIGAAPRLAAPSAASAPAKGGPKHLFKDVAKTIKTRRASAPAEGISAAALLKGCVTILIIGRALLRIFQRIVSLVDLLKGLFGHFIARVAVRMVLHRQLTEMPTSAPSRSRTSIRPERRSNRVLTWDCTPDLKRGLFENRPPFRHSAARPSAVSGIRAASC